MPDDSPPIAPELTPLHHLDDAWATRSAGPRLRAVRSAAERLRDHLVAAPRAVAVRTLPLTTLLYPTKYAFWGAAISPAPFVVMHHRCLLVQFLQRGELKALLFNPTDTIAARRTPYFRFLVETMGEYLAYEVLTRRSPSLEEQLSGIGLQPGDIDYVAFDHFHTQDLRSLLGTTDGAHAPRFPRARLLAPRAEWEAWDDLHPMQRAWFVADGKQRVRTDQITFTAGDLELGDGAWLLRTPGHTVGNQTLFVSTATGIWGTSENATSADCYSPFDSGIAGLPLAARQQEIDVILNANTPEQASDQYTSMVLERTLVDRVKRAPAFVQMLPSSEVIASPMAPGISPTMVHGSLTSGQIARPT
jgi:glyoxylase-like metal-dependent hydrolase (beta-lactamase superfamily II)